MDTNFLKKGGIQNYLRRLHADATSKKPRLKGVGNIFYKALCINVRKIKDREKKSLK